VKVLIIEDDWETADFVASGLKRDGHLVEIAGDCSEGFSLAASKTHDILIVDRRLPDADGLSLVRDFRARGGTAPVIFLTTMSSIDDRVEGFEAGGDDYLVKPFAFTELRARVQALARRPLAAQSETVLQVGDLEMDLIRRQVVRSVPRKMPITNVETGIEVLRRVALIAVVSDSPVTKSHWLRTSPRALETISSATVTT